MIFEWVHSVSIGIDIASITISFEVEKAAPDLAVAVISFDARLDKWLARKFER